MACLTFEFVSAPFWKEKEEHNCRQQNTFFSVGSRFPHPTIHTCCRIRISASVPSFEYGCL